MDHKPKLLIIIGVFSLVVIFGFFWSSFSSHKDNANRRGQLDKQHQVFDVAVGDTNNEVLKSIVAKQKELQSQNNKLIEENKKLQEDNLNNNKKALSQSEERLIKKISQSKESIENEFSKEIDTVKTRSHQSNTSQNSNLEYPMNDDGKLNKKNEVITDAPDLSSNFSGSLGDQQTDSYNSKNDELKNNGPVLPSDVSLQRSDKSIVPYYTIPALSTAANAVLLSPLVGEVPVNGHLQSPAFPFKAILSTRDTKSMFSANGVPLPPGISGAILQGYSVGSMSLGCSRAYVMKILFVFQGGNYVVFPKDKDGKSNSATEVYPKNSIGYLSNIYNNSCISGKYITDAPKVIVSLSGFGAASGVGQAIAQSQTQTLSNISEGTAGTIFNGNLAKYAAGLSASSASQAALDWYKSRVNGIFDAVFIPSTLNGHPRKLIFNITRTIPIDLNKKGRKLSYENSSKISATDTSFE